MYFLKEIRLIQNYAAMADATPHEHPVKDLHWNLGFPQKGKL